MEPERKGRMRWWLWPPLVLALLGLAVVFGAWRLQSTPVAAPAWLVERVEREASARLEGGSLDFRAIRVGLTDDWRPLLLLSEARVDDASDREVLSLRELRGVLGGRALLRGEVRVTRMGLSGAVLRLDRRRDGTFDLSIGTGADRAEAPDIATLLAQLDAVLEEGPGRGVEQIIADAITINYADAASGKTWTGDGGRIAIVATEDGPALTGEVVVLTGGGELSTLSLSFISGEGASGQLAAQITNVSARDVASQAPAVSWLSVLDTSLTAQVNVDLTEDGLGRVSASLDMGVGAVQPTSGAAPIGFEGAAVALSFDPGAARIDVDRFSVDSDLGRAAGRGHALLSAFEGRVPKEITLQLSLEELIAKVGDLYEQPLAVEQAQIDGRLRLDPFTLDIGQVAAVAEGVPMSGHGRVVADAEGWSVAVDGFVPRMGHETLMALWPARIRPGVRQWFARHLKAGEVTEAALIFRLRPDAKPRFAFSHHFEGAEVVPFGDMPPITGARGSATLQPGVVSVMVSEGQMVPPTGGVLDVSGTTFTMPDLSQRPNPAIVDLKAEGPMTAMFSVLDQAPLSLMSKAGLPVDLTAGRARAQGMIRFPLKKDRQRSDFAYDIRADVTGARTTTLVEGRTLAADRLRTRIRPDLIEVVGAARVDGVPADIAWAMPLGQGPKGSRVEGEVRLSNAVLRTFGVALPDGMIGGEGTGRLTLDLPPGAPPRYALTSDLAGLSLRVPAAGIAIPRSARGALRVEGQLGRSPTVEILRIDAPGLRAEGRLALAASGGFERAIFSDIAIGTWLRGAVTLTNRGAGRAPAISVRDARIDIRSAPFGAGGGSGGDGPPIELDLRELRITEGIRLTDVRGSLVTSPGIDGTLSARVDGGTPVRIDLVPGAGGPRIRVLADDGGGVIRDAGLFANITGGQLSLILTPNGRPGGFD
ncbi:MAG: hypothetical protein ACU0DW_06880, partial [Shimia sp.]